MGSVTNASEPKLEVEYVLHDESCTVSNSNIVDGLSSIGYAKKLVGVYWASAYEIVKENSYRLSKDILYNPFRHKVSDNIVRLEPILEEGHTALEEQSSLCTSKNITAVETVTASLDNRLVQPYSPGNQPEGRTEQTISPVVTIIRDICTNCEPREVTFHRDDEEVSNLPVHASTEIADPAPLLLLQRRLKSLCALAADDMTETICINQSNLHQRKIDSSVPTDTASHNNTVDVLV